MSRIRALCPKGYSRYIFGTSSSTSSITRTASIAKNNAISSRSTSTVIANNGKVNCNEMQWRSRNEMLFPALIGTRHHSSMAASPHYTDEKSNKSKSSKSSNIISDKEYDPLAVINNIHKAAQWNQGGGPDAKWDPQFCTQSVSAYTAHLKYIQHHLQQQQQQQQQQNNNTNTKNKLPPHAKELLSSQTTERALKAMLKMKIPTHELSTTVRETEKQIGSIELTPLTNTLSLRLLEANGKAGNIGRTLALLNLRKNRRFEYNRKEFEYAIQSIHSAGLYLRKNRNVFLNDGQQPEIDNPTRFLDAILENMSGRNVLLDTNLANRMLDCYACTGRNGKATHFFYKVSRKEVIDDSDDGNGDLDGDLDEMENEKGGELMESGDGGDKANEVGDKRRTSKSKIKMKLNQQLPPFYKIPSDVKLQNEMIKRPRKEGLVSKLEWEKEKDWSPSLAAAFAFADSLTHGACGHAPIELDLTSWNTMIKVCCYRGAIFRALEILNDTLPKNDFKPDVISYNTVLSALARVGDKDFMRELLTTMTNKGIKSNKYTAKALVDGYLNAGDVSGAVSLIQDMFNQHKVLPPYTTHLKIIEFALGNDLIYEAKREVYFIQQLWKWKPTPNESKSFQSLMYATQKNPKLSKKSLQSLFAYFGEELLEEDFF